LFLRFFSLCITVLILYYTHYSSNKTYVKYYYFDTVGLNSVQAVGLFPELNHTQFTWFGNLPTLRSYWFVLMKLTNNTNKGGGDKTLSTQLYSLKLSLFFSVLSSLCVSHAALYVLHTPYQKTSQGGHINIQLMGVRGSPPPCAKWEIR